MKRDLGRLGERAHDLLVIGGGISGATVAWDAAQRGLEVALLEAADFGSGTSWNSLKTIHGGLRHLQRGDVASQRGSMRERSALLRIAPELVKPLPFLIPVYGHGARGREAFWAALRLHDLLSADRNRALPEQRRIPRSRMLSPREVREQLPGLDGRGLTGGALWVDAQVESSERLLLAFLHAAAGAGAVIDNYVKASGFFEARAGGTGVAATNVETGDSIEVRARVVVNAAGPGMDGVLRMAGIERPPVSLLRAANLVLGRSPAAAVGVGSRARGPYLFLVPWQGLSIAGTDYGDAGAGDPEERERAFVAEVGSAFPWAGIKDEDVLLVHRGLVPGRDGAEGLLTRHAILDHGRANGRPDLLSILAVKYTTARGVAERVVDAVFEHLGRPSPPCRTAETPLGEARFRPGSLEERTRHACREEMAFHLSDSILRRLDLGTRGAPAAADVDVVAATMASEGGWDARRTLREREALTAELSRLRLGGR